MESAPFLTYSQRGFTLVEMMVVIAIIGFVTVVAITGQNDFNKSLTLTDTAYTVALSVRQAQTYGLSSRVFSGATNAGYGTRFDAATPNTYLLFSDISKVNYPAVPTYCPMGTAGQPDAKPGNCRYDASGSEMVQNYTFSRGFTITQLCGRDTGGGRRCSDDTQTAPLTSIDILFVRPNTTSVVTGTTAGGSLQLRDAMLKLSAPNNAAARYICVSQAGQVSVATTICP